MNTQLWDNFWLTCIDCDLLPSSCRGLLTLLSGQSCRADVFLASTTLNDAIDTTTAMSARLMNDPVIAIEVKCEEDENDDCLIRTNVDLQEDQSFKIYTTGSEILLHVRLYVWLFMIHLGTVITDAWWACEFTPTQDNNGRLQGTWYSVTVCYLAQQCYLRVIISEPRSSLSHFLVAPIPCTWYLVPWQLHAGISTVRTVVCFVIARNSYGWGREVKLAEPWFHDSYNGILVVGTFIQT